MVLVITKQIIVIIRSLIYNNGLIFLPSISINLFTNIISIQNCDRESNMYLLTENKQEKRDV